MSEAKVNKLLWKKEISPKFRSREKNNDVHAKLRDLTSQWISWFICLWYHVCLSKSNRSLATRDKGRVFIFERFFPTRHYRCSIARFLLYVHYITYTVWMKSSLTTYSRDAGRFMTGKCFICLKTLHNKNENKNVLGRRYGYSILTVQCDPSRWSGPQALPYPRNEARLRDVSADHSVTFYWKCKAYLDNNCS